MNIQGVKNIGRILQVTNFKLLLSIHKKFVGFNVTSTFVAGLMQKAIFVE